MTERVFFWIVAIVLTIIITNIPRELAAVREDHRSLLNAVQVQCVHEAKTPQERRECLTLELPKE